MLIKKSIVVFTLICSFFYDSQALAKIDNNNWDAHLNKIVGDVDNEKIYQRFAKGQCTWYAWGRFKEVHNKKIRFKGKLGLDAKLWSELIVNCRVDDKLEERSIGISTLGEYGHLIFIEHIDDGIVYYTEANGDGNGLYDLGVDCVLKKADVDSEFMESFVKFVHTL